MSCACGCGETPTPGHRYVQHHHARLSPVRYIVDVETGCWIWQGGLFGNGYPQHWRNKRPYPAHRAYYEDHVGPIPDGYDLDHLCRRPRCVNPAHLEPVTRRENARRGSGTKLAPDTVRAIRTALGTTKEIGAAFGIHHSYVSRIKNRKVWADVA